MKRNEEIEYPIKGSLMEILNDIDLGIIYLLSKYDGKISIAQLTKTLDVAHVNVWKHLKKLEKDGIVSLPKHQLGKKRFPKLKSKQLGKLVQLFMDKIMKVENL